MHNLVSHIKLFNNIINVYIGNNLIIYNNRNFLILLKNT